MMELQKARFNMIEQQIRTWDVLDQRVLDLLDQVPRENFVPENYRNLAYADISIPLGHGQVMMLPKLEARVVQALDIQPGDRILEIGTGSGYLTALLASLGLHVESVEIFPDLLATAGETLARHGITNVALHAGDASRGWHKDDTFDAIVITGATPILPDAFANALRRGGRLIAFVGLPPVIEATLITRTGGHEWAREAMFETGLPMLVNAEQPPQFVF
ncbi:MAG: protein-L-isoaspartate(D-aspartate) O-methyltransferase [Gammaproteobacteria bacterium]|nr:MAG: protein-L-isoaspartate(D-aspartate) O-methyltransferase [Gammaproteobacteria bacterium]TND02891.1 MAG: protein-L-isoaspartate(D-aspartate) O-methyltransferase [Gammaproteobacteria bacterium]